MHILIVGSPRNRTSYLSDAFSKHYNLENLYEILDFTEILRDEIYKGNLKKKLCNVSVMEKHLSYLNQQTQKIFDTNRAVVKLFPRHIVNTTQENYKYPFSIKNIEDINFQLVPNFSKVLRLDKFDEIIILNRDIVDSTISYIFNIFISPIHIIVNEQQKNYIHNSFKNIKINEKYYPLINFYIYEYILGHYLHEYIIKNYKTKELTYNNCIEYVENNLPNGVKTEFYKSDINYKKIISNYDEISDYVNSVYDKLKKQLFFSL
jgi:hypothetical protein